MIMQFQQFLISKKFPRLCRPFFLNIADNDLHQIDRFGFCKSCTEYENEYTFLRAL